MLDKLTIDDFAERVGETFTATATGGPTLTLVLREAEALEAPPGDQGRRPFSLEFTDAAQEHLPQQTLAVEHPELGAFDLFVVPLGPSEHGMRYEAIFT